MIDQLFVPHILYCVLSTLTPPISVLEFFCLFKLASKSRKYQSAPCSVFPMGKCGFWSPSYGTPPPPCPGGVVHCGAIEQTFLCFCSPVTPGVPNPEYKSCAPSPPPPPSPPFDNFFLWALNFLSTAQFILKNKICQLFFVLNFFKGFFQYFLIQKIFK